MTIIMKIAVIITAALLFGILRALHGRGLMPRMLSAAGMGIVSGGAYWLLGFGMLDSIVAGVVAFFLIWVGLLLGWGAYFSSFTGDIEATKQKEVEFATEFADIFEPVVDTAADARRHGIAGMIARYCMFVPLFLALFGWLWAPWMLPAGAVAIVASGFVYGALRYEKSLVEKYGTAAAELASFFIIGLALFASVGVSDIAPSHF